MNKHWQRRLVGAIAIAAVAVILSRVDLDANAEAGGKGKAQFKLDPCPACTDVCDPAVLPGPGEVCAEKRNGDTFPATLACCCCGENPLGSYYRNSPK
jgi:cell division septation protein DedD